VRRLDHPHPYEDAAGHEVFQHPKWLLDKPDERGRLKRSTYRWRRGPGYAWVPRKPRGVGADDLLYRLPDLLDEIGTPRYTRDCEVWWPEGERDTETLRDRGFVATSHHQAAGNATWEQAETFRLYRGRILLPADRDRAGAMDVVRRWDLLRAFGVRPARMRIVLSPLRFRGADITDHFQAGLGLDDLVTVPIGRARRSAARATPRELAICSSWFTKGEE
jgi:hypothetical protein